MASQVLALEASQPAFEFSSQNYSLANESFWEDFQSYNDKESLGGEWVISEAVAQDGSTGEPTERYKGKWDVQEPYNLKALKGDKALRLRNSDVAAMIGRPLSQPIECTADTDLVVQYEVQLQDNLNCGGAFIKLLPVVSSSELREYAGTSPVLELLFGPDMCPPYTDEIHLGIKKTNPYSMVPELKLLKEAPLSSLRETGLAHLYTLILKGSTNEYEIRVDGSVAKAGKLLEAGAFFPGFNPPKFVADPDAEKPTDWDEREFIPDPQAKKPEDWDESEPMYVIDSEVEKPADWDESMPELILDESRKRPDWWDDGKFGEWVAPMIENPACQEISGCGEWKPPIIENPKYKGLWEPPLIENPNYQGVWKPQHVLNPQYFEDSAPAKLENPVGGFVFEFWSGSSDLLIDNIYIGKHIEEAELLGNKTFIPKRAFQNKQNEDKLNPNAKTPRRPPPNTDLDDYPNFYDHIIDFIGNSLTALTERVSLSTVSLTLITIVIGLLSLAKRGSSPPQRPDPRKSE